MIQVDNLTKRYGKVIAADHPSSELKPGRAAGFLSPNGSGKSMTTWCIMGLNQPMGGKCVISSQEYGRLSSPLTTVGALLDGYVSHPSRMVRQQLMVVVDTHGFPRARIDEVLEMIGITSVVNKRPKGSSPRMGQCLGIATAPLGGPQALIFDGPVNGLDPNDVRWAQELMCAPAGQGRTILVSSHLMSEISQTADDLVVIGKGKLIAQRDVKQFTESAAHRMINVSGPDIRVIMDALSKARICFDVDDEDEHNPAGAVRANGGKRAQIGYALHAVHVETHELSEAHFSLEDVFMELTAGQVEYGSGNNISGVPGQTPAQAPQGGQR